MKKAIANDLGLFTSMLQSVHSRGEINQLASEFNVLILKATKSGAFSHTCEPRTVSACIKFTTDEINQMAKPFRSEIKRNGNCARIIKSVNGSGYQYEIRYRRNGYNITVTHTDLKTAKQLFIVSTFKVSKVDSVSQQAISTILSDEKSVQKCTDKKKKLIHIRNAF